MMINAYDLLVLILLFLIFMLVCGGLLPPLLLYILAFLGLLYVISRL